MRQEYHDLINEVKQESEFSKRIKEFDSLKELVESKLKDLTETVVSFEKAIQSNQSKISKLEERFERLALKVTEHSERIDDLSQIDSVSMEDEDDY